MRNYTFCKKCGLWITFHRLSNGLLGIYNMDTRYFHSRTCKRRRRAFKEAEQIRAEYERANDPKRQRILKLRKRLGV